MSALDKVEALGAFAYRSASGITGARIPAMVVCGTLGRLEAAEKFSDACGPFSPSPPSLVTCRTPSSPPPCSKSGGWQPRCPLPPSFSASPNSAPIEQHDSLSIRTTSSNVNISLRASHRASGTPTLGYDLQNDLQRVSAATVQSRRSWPQCLLPPKWSDSGSHGFRASTPVPGLRGLQRGPTGSPTHTENKYHSCRPFSKGISQENTQNVESNDRS